MSGFEYCLVVAERLLMMSCCDVTEGSEFGMMENLKIAFEIMGKGMAGLFFVVLIIMLRKYFTNKDVSKKGKKGKM